MQPAEKKWVQELLPIFWWSSYFPPRHGSCIEPNPPCWHTMYKAMSMANSLYSLPPHFATMWVTIEITYFWSAGINFKIYLTTIHFILWKSLIVRLLFLYIEFLVCKCDKNRTHINMSLSQQLSSLWLSLFNYLLFYCFIVLLWRLAFYFLGVLILSQ